MHIVILHIQIFDECIGRNDYDIVFDDEEENANDFIDGEDTEDDNEHQEDCNITNPLPKYGKIHIIHILMKYLKSKIIASYAME